MTERDFRQQLVGDWVTRTFGDQRSIHTKERATRLLEEALELAQCEGVSQELAERLLSHVYSRPPGDPFGELGGVQTTTLAYAAAAGYSADKVESEAIRVILGADRARMRERQECKADLGIGVRCQPDMIQIG